MSTLIIIGYIVASVALAFISAVIGAGLKICADENLRGSELLVLSCLAGIVGALWVALIYFAPFTVTL